MCALFLVESPATIGSLQSLNMDSMMKHTFQPDYTVRACSEVLYLKLKRNLYFAAKRASLMEMSQRDSVTNGDPFDDEVEKVSVVRARRASRLVQLAVRHIITSSISIKSVFNFCFLSIFLVLCP